MLTPSYHPNVSLICSVVCASGGRMLQWVCRMLNCRDWYIRCDAGAWCGPVDRDLSKSSSNLEYCMNEECGPWILLILPAPPAMHVSLTIVFRGEIGSILFE